ncbi:tyrosine-type recombinase/integrase [Leptothrix discophora]|uniref:Tyrosine-type recombinase/integrase n=1 Tax=Leptothrix discophora TaxID=89 RepID=A0ABT9G1K6_LEPDI|nr:tyrosine-type recombinase/integrase [Leptothrix discophora]MDP4300384.1 tyrosine-type recombinase/integrase [Leptothrix discophora]
MAQVRGPVPGVFVSSGRYFKIRRSGARKVWHPLTRVDEGLPALHRALAALLDVPADHADSVVQLVKLWEGAELARYALKTRKDAQRLNVAIRAAFVEFRAGQVTPADVAAYLAPLRRQPRNHNAHRAQLRELMRYAELQGWRPPGSNPVLAVRTMATPARTRYLSDSEIRRIKVGAMRGKDGALTRSGPMLCALIDVLYLTGQPIGDVLGLEVGDVEVGAKVVTFRRSKVAHSTGSAVSIEISPRLRAAFDRLLAVRASVGRELLHRALVVTQDGSPARYDGVKTAWQRALERSGVRDAHIHDLKAKALTDTERRRGMREARKMGQHSTEKQTAAYVRARSADVVQATR